MTREEAIQICKEVRHCLWIADEQKTTTIWDKGAVSEAMLMAIEALQTDIVRCKDCKYKGKVGDLIVCRIHEVSTRTDDYCSRGERNE